MRLFDLKEKLRHDLMWIKGSQKQVGAIAFIAVEEVAMTECRSALEFSDKDQDQDRKLRQVLFAEHE